MSNFKDHKISASQLLGLIPQDLLSQLSLSTHVDHYTKVLHGIKMFYLLVYGLLENERLSQRSLEDTFNDPVFKMLFGLDETESVRHSSISERLSRINSDYFRQIYECIYRQFSACYCCAEQEEYNLIRVDSSMVTDLSGRLMKGLKNNKGKKSVKYSVAFDGLFPCGAEAFNDISYSSEDIALPEVVRSHV